MNLHLVSTFFRFLRDSLSVSWFYIIVPLSSSLANLLEPFFIGRLVSLIEPENSRKRVVLTDSDSLSGRTRGNRLYLHQFFHRGLSTSHRRCTRLRQRSAFVCMGAVLSQWACLRCADRSERRRFERRGAEAADIDGDHWQAIARSNEPRRANSGCLRLGSPRRRALLL